ncbi:hypothetical protein KQ313_00595 [Synechococcus sp. CS-1325]|uniref:hypothetical protein n=1 Tax=Synechococcus sp. CS-1325 TaxID=2847979 RepID=UPI00223A7BEB|nr:hypothetical protein [Synechococcus sp. CS-1325]MCT0198191.1 hypothetical protein [Synechococcus sp. CS-1325]
MSSATPSTSSPPTSRPPALVLFGGSSLCGQALISQRPVDMPLQLLSRQPLPAPPLASWHHCDLTDLRPAALEQVAITLPPGPQVWIGFAHLWQLAPFLEALSLQQPQALQTLRAVVACSSSSVITKRFAANRVDRELVARLGAAQDLLLKRCRQLAVPCRILAPTLIHGRLGEVSDRNLEQLRSLLRRLPLLPLPTPTGLRQPIAANELAAVALDQARRLLTGEKEDGPGGGLLPLGGDETITYLEMLRRLQASDPAARRCRLLPVPTRLFQALAAPLLLLSPKHFEAVLRISADLAGFCSAAELLERPPRLFQPCPAPGCRLAVDV